MTTEELQDRIDKMVMTDKVKSYIPDLTKSVDSGHIIKSEVIDQLVEIDNLDPSQKEELINLARLINEYGVSNTTYTKLTSLEVIKQFPPIDVGLKIEFKKDITLLVGDQGAGKSTLLELIRLAHKDTKPFVKIKADGEGAHVSFFDTRLSDPKHIHQENSIEFQMAVIRDLRDDCLAKTIGMFEKIKEDNPEINPVTNKIETKTVESIGKIFNDYVDDFANEKNELKYAMLGKKYTTDEMLKFWDKSHGESLYPLLQAMINSKGLVILIDEPETALSVRSQIQLMTSLKESSKHNQIIISTHSPILMQLSESLFEVKKGNWISRNEYLVSQYEDGFAGISEEERDFTVNNFIME